jgi:tetratricopeptide (TPR) repeat protein
MPQPIRARGAHPERRWRVSPPISAPVAGTLAGLGILEEVPGELGGLLWRSLRAVTLWAAVPASERGALFAPGAQEERLADLLAAAPEPALEAPLATLAGLLGRPASSRPELVALACTRIARWAESRGAQATEADFSHAATLVCPGDPRLALSVGRTARDRGEYLEAESWYGRTVILARQVTDWDTYARAHVGLGKMWMARGSFPSARRTLQKAARAAQRHGVREVWGMALHDLFAVEIECDNTEQAYAYAAAALRVYGPGHCLLPTLAHDIAYLWITCGRFTEALPVLRVVVPRMPVEQMLYGQGSLARAAGGVGDQAIYQAAWDSIWSAHDEAPGKSDGLVEAARAAISLGLFPQAEQAAQRALAIARGRGEAKIVFVAEGVLESARNERQALTRQKNSVSEWAGPAPTRQEPDTLAIDLMRCLELAPAGG